MPKIMKSCLHLLKLRPTYCLSLFSGHSAFLKNINIPGINTITNRLCKTRRFINFRTSNNTIYHTWNEYNKYILFGFVVK